MGPSLLIVEDLPDVGRSYLRALRRYAIDEVRLATTAEEAEQLLAHAGPTLVMCDHWLGEGQPSGAELLRRWRRSYPQIAKAILVTGADSVIERESPGVDAVFEKPPDLGAIAGFLGLQRKPR